MDELLPAQKKRLNPIESFFISIGFWVVLLIASAMFAALFLAPKLVENSRLQRQVSMLQSVSDSRRHEVQHLQRLAHAIEHDKDFLNRIREKEFSVHSKGTIQIQVPKELGFDARVPQRVGSRINRISNTYDDFLIQLSSATRLRRYWSFSTLTLFLIAALVMNQYFFSGKIGKMLLSGVGHLFHRYRLPPTKLDEEACQPTP